MSIDPRVTQLARKIQEIERKFTSLSTSRRLANSSLEDSSLPEYDADGNLVAIIGKQPDGTHGIVDYDGPIPPVPVGLEALGGPVTITAVWGGQLAEPRPLDLHLIEVYASREPFAHIEEAQIVGSIIDVDGGRVTFARESGTWHIGLVAVSRSGKRSAVSELASAEATSVLDSAVLEELEQNLAALRGELDALEDETLPGLEGDIARLRDETLPALESQLTAARNDLTTAFPEGPFDVTTAVGDAEAAASEAASAASAAVAAANGKNRQTYTDVEPADAPGPAPTVEDGAGRAQFDTHRNRSSVDGTIFAEWTWSGTDWVPVHLGDEMLRSLDVGKLTAGEAAVDEAVIQRLAVAIAIVIELNADRITAGEIGAGRINAVELAAELAEFITVKAGNVLADEAGFDTAVIGQLWTDFFATRKLTAQEADLGSFAADEGFIADLQAAIVTADLFRGHTFEGVNFIGSTFRASEGVFDMTLSGRGLRMVNRQSASVTRRFGIGGTPLVVGSEVYIGQAGTDDTSQGLIAVYNPTTGVRVRTLPGLATGSDAKWSPEFFATDGASLYVPYLAPFSTDLQIRKMSLTGAIQSHITPSTGVAWGPAGPTLALPDGRLVITDVFINFTQIGLAVLNSFGGLIREIELPPRPPYSKTQLAFRNGVLYEASGGEVRQWNIDTGALIRTWQVGPGTVRAISIFGDTLYVSLSDTVGGRSVNYVMGFDLLTGVEAFHWSLNLNPGETIGQVAVVGNRIYASLGTGMGEISVGTNETVHASISTATGGVMFRDADLIGTTTAENINAKRVGGPTRLSTELWAPLTRTGINHFQDVFERDAYLSTSGSNAIPEGMECTTASPAIRWRYEANAWRPMLRVPEPFGAEGAAQNDITRTSWGALPTDVSVSINVPYHLWVVVAVAAAVVLPRSADVRMSAQVSGATSIGPIDHGGWGSVVWGVNGANDQIIHNLSNERSFVLNPGNNTIRLVAYRGASVTGTRINYPVLRVIPQRWR